MKKVRLILPVFAASLGPLAHPAWAQYPAKSIRYVVPFPPAASWWP